VVSIVTRCRRGEGEVRKKCGGGGRVGEAVGVGMEGRGGEVERGGRKGSG